MSDGELTSAEADRRDAGEQDLLQAGAVIFLRRQRRRKRRSFAIILWILLFHIGILWQTTRAGLGKHGNRERQT